MNMDYSYSTTKYESIWFMCLYFCEYLQLMKICAKDEKKSNRNMYNLVELLSFNVAG